MPGTLYVVATPIGNLEDITLRAIRVLREVDLIAAEDTRRTARLLQHYSIATPTTSLHEHNEHDKAPRLVERLLSGSSVALVSDAGTPLVSDPGAHLVRLARQAGVQVVPVPGASALMATLAGTGAGESGFTFLGFPPYKSTALKKWVADNLSNPGHAVIFFEAPHRITKTLGAMLEILGDRPIMIGRELTKIHEELVERPISGHLEAYGHAKGEFVVLVTPSVSHEGPASTQNVEAQIRTAFGHLIENNGMSPREAARHLAERHHLSANQVYRIARVPSK